MAYNRLTGDFNEIHGGEIPDSRSMSRYDSATGLPYGISDDQRDTMLQWARKERLPLFLRFVHFLFLKLPIKTAADIKFCEIFLDIWGNNIGLSHCISEYSLELKYRRMQDCKPLEMYQPGTIIFTYISAIILLLYKARFFFR